MAYQYGKKKPSEVDDVDIEGNSFLHRLALFGSKGYQGKLVQHFRSKGANVGIRNSIGMTPLHLAVQEGQLPMVKALLEEELAYIPPSDNHDTFMTNFLTASPKINAQSPWGLTALQMACRDGHPQIVELLLNHGAEIDMEIQFFKTANVVYEAGCIEIFESLSRRGAEVSNFRIRDFSDEDPKIIVKEKHLIKMTIAKLHAARRKMPVDIKSKKIRESYRRLCNAEIARAKSTFIADSNVCFHDMISQGIRRLTAYSRNQAIAKVMKAPRLLSKFPIYGTLMRYNFIRGEQRDRLLCICEDIIASYTSHRLPIEVVRYGILDHLDNSDLENLIEAKYGSSMYR